MPKDPEAPEELYAGDMKGKKKTAIPFRPLTMKRVSAFLDYGELKVAALQREEMYNRQLIMGCGRLGSVELLESIGGTVQKWAWPANLLESASSLGAPDSFPPCIHTLRSRLI